MNLINLSRGMEISIRNESYKIEGYVVYKHRSGYEWKEYELRNVSRYGIAWLSVSLDGESEVSLHLPLNSKYEFDREFSSDNLSYELYEDDYANVQSSSGNMDVDKNEYVEYVEYRESSGKYVLTEEKWERESEYSKGFILSESEVISGHTTKSGLVSIEGGRNSNNNTSYSDNYQNTGGYSNSNYNDNNYNEYNQKSYDYDGNKKRVGVIVGIAIAVLVLLMTLKGCVFGKDVVAEQLDNDSKFSYLTHVTPNGYSKYKSPVYKTDMSIDETYSYLKSLYGSKILNSSKNTEDKSAIMNTKDEYIMIYENEDGDTVVQVIDSDFMDNNRNTDINMIMYRPRYNNSWIFYKTFHDTNTSIRRSSSGSRVFQGGGTSFGK